MSSDVWSVFCVECVMIPHVLMCLMFLCVVCVVIPHLLMCLPCHETSCFGCLMCLMRHLLTLFCVECIMESSKCPVRRRQLVNTLHM